MLRTLVRRVRESMSSPAKVMTASFEGLWERNEWIRKNRVCNLISSLHVSMVEIV